MTAKETEDDHDGGQAKDANSSDNSDQDETFELVDVDEVRETGKKARKGKKKISAKEKKSERKRKKLKRVEKGDEDMVKTKEKIKRKKKTVAFKRNTDEVRDVKMKAGVSEEDGVKKKGKKKRLQKESTDGGPEKEPERKKKKRKSSEEMNEVSKRNRKAKMLLSSGIEDVQEETGEDMTFGNDDEQLLIEGDGIQENESFQTQDTEVIDSKVTVADGNKSTLNPKNVFQIEDLGKENDLLNYADCDSDDETLAHRMTIQEAFANDDVIEEFVKEKEDTAETSKPKEVDLSLPGWGDWGGPGIDETKRKKKFKVPSKPTRARKDTKLAHVIINEDRDKKFAKNQVITRPTLYILHTALLSFYNCRMQLSYAFKACFIKKATIFNC